MDPKLTGKIISEKRKEKGLNQIQLGELLNVSNRTISKWENGDGFPDITLLPDISNCLDISIDELLTGKKPESTCPAENDAQKADDKKIINEFRLCYIGALFFGISAALLGGVTEVYCIWAFNILFYTHWEIMFAAVSLFAVIASAFLFVIGIFRLHCELTKKEIISYVHKKLEVLILILAVFPLTFTARIVELSRYGNFMPYIMLFIIAVLMGLAVLIKRRLFNEKNN